MKIDLYFGQGRTTCLYDMNAQKVYRYEQDYESIHKLLGGKKYYGSRSGGSGAGYAELPPHFMEIGTYRRCDTRGTLTPIYTSPLLGDICVSVPIGKHSDALPIVLTNKRDVIIFTSTIPHGIDRIKSIENTGTYQVNNAGSVFNGVLEEHIIAFYLDNPLYYGGVNSLMFLVDVVNPLRTYNWREFSTHSLLAENLHIRQHTSGLFAHVNTLDLIDTVYYGESPYSIKGPIEGTTWWGNGSGLFWTRRESKIMYFVEIEPPPLEYEDYWEKSGVIDAVEFFSKTQEQLEEDF